MREGREEDAKRKGDGGRKGKQVRRKKCGGEARRRRERIQTRKAEETVAQYLRNTHMFDYRCTMHNADVILTRLIGDAQKRKPATCISVLARHMSPSLCIQGGKNGPQKRKLSATQGACSAHIAR